MNFYIKNIRVGIFWTCQVIFWLAACLALLNRLYASGGGVGDYWVAALLACWASVIFLLLRALKTNTTLLRFAVRNWSAAIVLGVIFQVEVFLTYIAIIIVTEIIQLFLLRKNDGEKIWSKKNKRRAECNEIKNEYKIAKINDAANNDYKDNDYKDNDADKFNIEIDDEIADEIVADESDNLSISVWEAGKTQHIIRRKMESGGEKLEGYFLVEFDENQLTVSVHIPFYPAFEQSPVVEAYLMDDTVDAKLTIARTQLFGAKIDIKRANKNVNNLRLAVIVLG
jgi:hypothetical protein